MFKNYAQKAINKLICKTDITINGDNPWDMKVLNQKLYSRILRHGSLGLGEAYMDGWWDCDQLDQFFYKATRAKLANESINPIINLFKLSTSYLFNMQSKTRGFIVGKTHYDLDNKLYALMLDQRMTYSCGYWKNASTLDEAQTNKLSLICHKLKLTPGMKVLDIGCGWGSFAQFAAKEFGVSVVGITISKEQEQLAKQRCQGLPVEIRLQDYRELNEPFDRIISIGMFEHVGPKNYRTFMRVCKRCLKDNGLMLLHTIGSTLSSNNGDPWLSKYIFPNGVLPSINQIGKSSEGLLNMEDWHNFGQDYDTTLMKWHANFTDHWDTLKNRYDNRFKRMWDYYLLSCAGAFRSRDLQLWQIVFSPKGLIKGYLSIR